LVDKILITQCILDRAWWKFRTTSHEHQICEGRIYWEETFLPNDKSAETGSLSNLVHVIS